MALLGDGHLQATAFFASSHNNDQCGSNGLPLTPNSVRIIGRFQLLTDVRHPNLCSYVDLQRGKRGKILIALLLVIFGNMLVCFKENFEC